MKRRVLVFCDFYLPGFKSGGGVWTVVNLVDRFCDRYDFFIVTRNYDSKSDTKPYDSVKTGEWNTVGNAQVHYLAAGDIDRRTCAKLTLEIDPDCVFLNSAFSTPVVKFLMARQAGLIPPVPVVLAPCGEFSEGAMASKPLKKKVYLTYAKLRHLYEKVIWKATTESEVIEIKRLFGSEIEIMTAPDLAPKTILLEYSPAEKPRKTPGKVKFVFLSRVVPKKNLRYFLKCLRSIDRGKITLEIVGPLEDAKYWRECEEEIQAFPGNINVIVAGPVSYPEGLQRLINGHFFVLPTLNENFGYVCIESLAAGTPLIISEQTVWDDVERDNCGWILPLDRPENWVAAINRCVEMDANEFEIMSESARKFAVTWLKETNLDEPTAQVLERAMAAGV